MRILFVADGRSPIALNWINGQIEAGHEVHLQSSFSCQPELSLASLTTIPLTFSRVAGTTSRGGRVSGLRRVFPVGLRTTLRQWLVPHSLSKAATSLQSAIKTIKPDLIHAMRIPFEGMVSALAIREMVSPPPLLVSIWGNDFTLHAPSTRHMAELTRQTLKYASAQHADCWRDLRLAREWGFAPEKPTIVLPGGGGVQPEVFYPGEQALANSDPAQTVIQPRGFRAYVQNEAFFKAIPLILAQAPQTRFLLPGMADEIQAQDWVRQLSISQAVELLPYQTRSQMADLFRQSHVIVSPTTHDGTPNTLLEALACGCFPVAGDIESLREWINPGVNGLLCDPTNPSALAEDILQALSAPDLRQQARSVNLILIAEHANYSAVMEQAQAFYRYLIDK